MKKYILHIWIKEYNYKVGNFDYQPLYNMLKKDFNGEMFSDGLWFLYTDKSAKEINEAIMPLSYNATIKEENKSKYPIDIWFICEMGSDYEGFFFKTGFNWIENHVNKK